MTAKCIFRQAHSELGEIQVWDDDDIRRLCFDDVIIQSEIYLSDPAVLPNVVNRAMLAHLMFVDTTSSVLLAGCGGGAIARWFHARAPKIQGKAIELSTDIAEIALKHFDFPRENWQIITRDIRDYFAEKNELHDFILVDMEEQQWSPEWIVSEDFLEACHDHLSAQGVLTLNLICRHKRQFKQALKNIRRTFPEGSLCLHNKGHDNILVMAFRQKPDISNLDEKAKKAAKEWGLEFGRFLKAIRQDNPEMGGLSPAPKDR